MLKIITNIILIYKRLYEKLKKIWNSCNFTNGSIIIQNEIIKKFGKPYFQDKYNLKYKNIEFTFNSLNEIKQIVILNKIYVLRKDITINSYIQDFYKAYKEYSPINNQVILDENNIIISCETKNNKITKIIITT